jgi:hypothetical protein
MTVLVNRCVQRCCRQGCRQLQAGSLCSPDAPFVVADTAFGRRGDLRREGPITDHFSPITLSRYPHGRGCGVGRSLRGGMGLGVGVGRIVAVGVAVGVGVTVGVGVIVGVGLGGGAVGVGVASDWIGAWTVTEMGEPVLKNPMFAVDCAGGALESKRKLYNVPKRIALAFSFSASVWQFHVAELKPLVKSQGSLLYPALSWVPSWAKPGCCGGAWNPTLLRTGAKEG